MEIIIRKQSFFTSLTSHIDDVFDVYMDDIVFASCNTHDQARTFAHGLMAGVKYLGKNCSIVDKVPIEL